MILCYYLQIFRFDFPKREESANPCRSSFFVLKLLGGLQKLRSSLKVETLKKPWVGVSGATQCNAETKSLKVSFDVERFTESIPLASQLS